MNIKIKREPFAVALASAFSIIEPKSIIRLWECFYFELNKDSLNIYSRSSLLQMKLYQKVESQDVGTFVVPASTLFETVRLLKCEEIELSVEESDAGVIINLQAVGRKKNYKIASYRPDEFSIEKHENIEGEKVLSSGILKEILTTSSNFIKNEELRKICTGVSLRNDKNGDLEFAATNGFLMSRHVVKGLDISIDPCVIPRKSCVAISNLRDEGDVRIFRKGSYFVFTDGYIEISTLLIDFDEGYPDISVFWEKEYKSDHYIMINKIELIDAMKILNVYSNSKHRLAEFHLGPDYLRLKAEPESKNSVAEETISCVNTGHFGFVAGYNVMSLSMILNSIEGDNVKIHFCGEKKPAFIEEEQENNNGVSKSFLIQAIAI